MLDQIAVLIPCYNESLTIGKVVRDFRQALPEATIYVYDNNSTDGTGEIARQAGAVVRYERKQGKGNVIRLLILIYVPTYSVIIHDLTTFFNLFDERKLNNS